jgi:hypothetical protein
MANPDVSSIQLSPESFPENGCHWAGLRNGADRDAKTGDRDRSNIKSDQVPSLLRMGASRGDDIQHQ